eukprot:202718-Chlamydomonas_euryale.AAC.2
MLADSASAAAPAPRTARARPARCVDSAAPSWRARMLSSDSCAHAALMACSVGTSSLWHRPKGGGASRRTGGGDLGV